MPAQEKLFDLVNSVELPWLPKRAPKQRPWQQVAIAPGVFMWATPGEPELHLYPPNGTFWDLVKFAPKQAAAVLDPAPPERPLVAPTAIPPDGIDVLK